MTADVPVIPGFDELIVSFGQFLGVSVTVLALTTLAFSLASYIGPGKSVLKGAMSVSRGARELAAHPPVNPLASLLITLVALAAQALTLGLCFLGGNYISMIGDNAHYLRAKGLFQENGLHSLSPEIMAQAFQWDPVSKTYVLAAFLLILWSYVISFRNNGSGVQFVGTIIGAPAGLLFIAAAGAAMIVAGLGIFTLILSLLAGTFGETLREVLTNALPLVIGGSICWLYLKACEAATKASLVVARSWSSGRPG